MKCHNHSEIVRKKMYHDPCLGVGNFLLKIIEEEIDLENVLFYLEKTWISPYGKVNKTFSYSTLISTVRELATWYSCHGISADDKVCIYTDEGISQFLHSIALMSLRAIPCPVNFQMDPEITLKYYEKYKFDFLIIDEHKNSKYIEKNLPNSIKLLNASKVELFDCEGELTTDWPATYTTEDVLVMICHSSGTTGIPKAVLFHHQQFFIGKRERLLHFLESGVETMLTALPHSHSAGFSYLMTSVLLGVPTVVLSKLSGASVIKQLKNNSPTIMVAFPQTWAYMANHVFNKGELGFLSRCYNTGDTAHEPHIKSLFFAAPNLRFYDGFGASELGMALFIKSLTSSDKLNNIGCIGEVVSFATAKIKDDNGNNLPIGVIGYIAINSPSITHGYYKNQDLTNRCRTKDFYWLTGDIGYTDHQGKFYHLDRAVDVIQTPNGSMYTIQLEELLLSKSNLVDVIAIGVPLTPRISQIIVVFINVDGNIQESKAKEILDILDLFIRKKLGSRVPIAVVNMKKQYKHIRGATGKSLKHILRDNFWNEQQKYINHENGIFDHLQFTNYPGY